ncbi:unnamed protein product, partial [Mycena citricolor]
PVFPDDRFQLREAWRTSLRQWGTVFVRERESAFQAVQWIAPKIRRRSVSISQIKPCKKGPPIPTHQPRWVSILYKLDQVCIAFLVEACAQAGQLIFDNSPDCWDDAPLRSDTHQKRLPHRIGRAAVRNMLPTSRRRTRTSYRHSKYPLWLVPAVSRSGMEYGRDNSRQWQSTKQPRAVVSAETTKT